MSVDNLIFQTLQKVIMEKKKKKKEKKEKKLKKEKKAKKEKKIEEKKAVVENKRLSPKKKTKRALSPPSEAEDFDDPIPAKTSKKQKTNSTFDEPTADDRGIEIGNNRFVSVKCFKGKTYLDIREFFNSPKDCRLMPGKKGVTLKREQWNAFRDAFFDIDEKIQTARAEDEEPMDLGLNKRIAVTKFKGKYLLIDIREMYDKDGEQRPGKGIALKPENYNKIKEFQNEIDAMW